MKHSIPPVLTLLAVLLMLPVQLQAQPYNHAGGVRAGYTSGITYKGLFLHSMNGVEIDAGYNNHGLNLSALYVMHREVSTSSRWLLYGGGGVFGGEWDQEVSAGLVAMGGIEYVVRDLPLNFGFDWKPMINLYKVFDTDFLDFAVTIRYRFSL
ncbi:MAG: hypothetical protein ABFS10_00245 [Bacteroidota bacterium]